MMRGYEQVLPGAAERLFRYIEIEQAHRHDVEKLGKAHDHSIATLEQATNALLSKRGQWLAMGIGTLALGVCGVIAWKGQVVPAGLAAFLDVAVVVGISGKAKPK